MSKVIKIEKGLVYANNGSRIEASTLQLISQSLDSGTPEGLTIKDFRDRAKIDRIVDALPKDATEVVFPDELYETLKTAVLSVRWFARTKLVSDFVLFFDDADQYEILPAPAEARVVQMAPEQ